MRHRDPEPVAANVLTLIQAARRTVSLMEKEELEACAFSRILELLLRIHPSDDEEEEEQ